MICKVCRRSEDEVVKVKYMLFTWGGAIEAYGVVCEHCKNSFKELIEDRLTMKDRVDEVLKEEK